jgi:squalene cyclase
MNADRRAVLEAGIKAGWRYIEDKQSGAGQWSEWELPPGISTTWTTAYIGCALRLLPSRISTNARTVLHRAADWLLSNESPEGGWGYNRNVGIDADSTACAILFLDSEGFTVCEETYETLLSFQRPDGGFSTYKDLEPFGSWCRSHVEVTSLAVLALLTKYPRHSEVIERGISHVIQQQRQGGGWNSFWWRSWLYATAASLAVFEKTDVEIDTRELRQALVLTVPENPFECALWLACTAAVSHNLATEDAWFWIERLLSQQQPDGSWKSEPILRVTNRDCFEPWKSEDSGRLYSDPARLFTSSTVVAALCRAWKFL